MCLEIKLLVTHRQAFICYQCVSESVELQQSRCGVILFDCKVNRKHIQKKIPSLAILNNVFIKKTLNIFTMYSCSLAI